MKYLCLICSDENRWETLPPAEQERVVGEHLAFAEELRRGGHYLAGEALQPTPTARTVRTVAGGAPLITDGPFAETKEQFGGFYLIEARDLDDATALAARIPMPGFGCVEVRPVWDVE